MNHPLALIVYNRPEHTARVLGALAPQKPHPIFVFCDGPKDTEDMQGVNAARAVVMSAIRWTGPVIFMRNKHLGLAKSVVEAVDKVLAQFETVIILEDDCLPGPWFYQFMCDCLDWHADDPPIMAVTGYTPRAEANVWTWCRMETWGWGTWRRAWKLYERDVADAYRRAIDKGIDLEQGGSDLPGYMKEAMEGKDVWSAGWQLAAYLNNGYCLYPPKSHITNIGLDGSGRHCGVGTDPAPMAEGPTEA